MDLEVLLVVSRGENRYLVALDLDGKLSTRSTGVARCVGQAQLVLKQR